MSDAVQDLIFLGKRLKGIIELSETLTTKSALENSIVEHKNSLKILKDSIEQNKKELNNSIASVSNTKAQHLKLIQDTEIACDEALKEAKDQASKIVQEASLKASKLIEAANSSVLSIEAKIFEKNKTLEDINNSVDVSTKKLDSLNKELSNLRSRF